ncbi:hypothetical protein [Escherichia coli]|uniref:hypothetical protein n=1 Tax=Escherichia coli TaxID=562 RepID=UPI0006A081A0|nr:hypothetical protein [Escherichia coli]CTW21754.1 Uncharacterised protein [Escherichia coli]CTX59083.1 Uncharacterised protein [Escherichia coli]
MFRKLFKSVTSLIDAELRHNLRMNSEYQKYRWNIFERLLAWCSTYYGRAMLILWVGAIMIVLACLYLRPLLAPFGKKYFKGIEMLPQGLSDLLGGQLTIIGIVFPLVVGLISVLFQKKSTREHIQSAYQLYSGYMFAGLSGLSLAAFILVSELLSARGDKYLDICLVVVAIIWMIMNIGLSIWFFIQSLNVLDDRRRDRIMLKYFISKVVVQHIRTAVVKNWLAFPGDYINKRGLLNVSVDIYDSPEKENSDLLKLKLKMDECVRDVYTLPLLFLLRRLKPDGTGSARIRVLPGWGIHKGEVVILATTGIRYNAIWEKLFKLCFIRGSKWEKTNFLNFTRGFYGEVYDALDERNLGAFEEAADRLVSTFITLKRCFQYDDKNYMDNVSVSFFPQSFSQSFHNDFYRLAEDVVKTLDTTPTYFRKIMHLPLSFYQYRGEDRTEELRQALQSQSNIWQILLDWNAGNRELSVNQKQRYVAMLQYFIGEWESWHMWLRLAFKNNADMTGYAEALELHLFRSLEMLITAITSDDIDATDLSTDMFTLWLNQGQFHNHYHEEYLWHSHFLTPDFLLLHFSSCSQSCMLRGKAYNEKAALSLTMRNVITDLRLFLSAYMVRYLGQQKNINLLNVIKRLLSPALVSPTGAYNILPPAIVCQTDVIDIILRLTCCHAGESSNWLSRLSHMVEKLTRSNKGPVISGRIYMGRVDDLNTLYPAFADIAVMLSVSEQSVSKKVITAISEGIFSFSDKKNIVHILKSLKKNTTEVADNFLMTSEEYATRVVFFNRTLDMYISTFEESIKSDIIKAEEDIDLFRRIDMNISQNVIDDIKKDHLLSLFEFTPDSEISERWEKQWVNIDIDKENVAKKLGCTIDSSFFFSTTISDCILNEIHRKLYINRGQLSEDISDLDKLFHKVTIFMEKEDDCTLIVYGNCFSMELYELEYRTDKHNELGIKRVSKPDKGYQPHVLPYMISNCTIYFVPNCQDNYSLLVRNSSFGRLRLFRYPDDTMFCTFCRENADDPLKSIITHLWEQDAEVTDPVIAMFNHV